MQYSLVVTSTPGKGFKNGYGVLLAVKVINFVVLPKHPSIF